MPIRRWGTEQLVNTTTASGQRDSSVAALANGGFVVTWTDESTTDSKIRFQIYDAAGQRVGTEQTFTPSNTGNQTRSTVAGLSNGNFVIYEEDYNTPTNTDIDGQVFTANGTHVSFPDASTSSVNATPDVASIAGGGWAVAWADTNANGGDIKVRVFNNAGVGGSTVTANTYPSTLSQSQSQPSIAYNEGVIAVVWTDAGLNGNDVRLVILDYSGSFFIPEKTVNTTVAGAQFEPKVSFVGGRIVVTWFDLNAEGTGAAGLKGQIMQADGSFVGGEFLITTQRYDQRYHDLVGLPNGTFVVAWEDMSGVGYDSDNTSIHMQVFDGMGQRLGAEMVVNTTTVSAQMRPTITALADSRVVVTWTDFSATGADTASAAIRMQIVDPRDGVVTGSTSGEILYGHDAVNDEILAGGGADTIYGLGGNDVITSGDGSDRVFGGAGDDTAIYYSTYAATPVVRLAHGSIRVGDASPDYLRGVERLQFNDRTLTVRGYAASDVNGDGDSDIITYSQSTGIVTRLDMQDGFQIGGGEVGRMGSGAWRVQQTGDFNYDANSDLVLKNTSTGQFYIWTQFGGMQNGGKDLGVIGTSWDVVSTGDYNADGAFDILWRNGANGQFYVWTFNSAMAQTGSANLGILGTNWTAGPSGDFDGDGDSDVLLRDTSNGQFYVYTMQNGVQAGGTNLGILGTAWTIAEVGDFNGDMRSDIALKNTSTGQFYLWLMNADLTYTGVNLGTVGADWNIAATGDYNADGTDDLLWRNASTGQTYLWTMDSGRQAETGSHHLGFLNSDLVIV